MTDKLRKAVEQTNGVSKCNPHPEAPHGFNRQESHTADEYVCDCAGFDPYDAGYQAGIHAAWDSDGLLLPEGWALVPSDSIAETPEAVAWLSAGGDVSRSKKLFDDMGFTSQPLYTAPPSIDALIGEIDGLNAEGGYDHFYFDVLKILDKYRGKIMNGDVFKKLIVKYADGRQICNCGEAYLTNCGTALRNGNMVRNHPVCKFGCSANQLQAKYEMADRIYEEIK